MYLYQRNRCALAGRCPVLVGSGQVHRNEIVSALSEYSSLLPMQPRHDRPIAYNVRWSRGTMMSYVKVEDAVDACLL